MRYLCIDFGNKRVGIAMSDDSGLIAFPYKILSNNLELVDTIHNICGEESISAIVLGESNDLYGKPNKIMVNIEALKINLEMDLGLPVYYQKEFMTTIEARGKNGKETNSAKKIVKGKHIRADASAAALILQRYLDKKNQK